MEVLRDAPLLLLWRLLSSTRLRFLRRLGFRFSLILLKQQSSAWRRRRCRKWSGRRTKSGTRLSISLSPKTTSIGNLALLFPSMIPLFSLPMLVRFISLFSYYFPFVCRENALKKIVCCTFSLLCLNYRFGFAERTKF